jgi:hypothetical protein
MKKTFLFLFVCIIQVSLLAGNIEKTYFFDKYKITTTGIYQTFTFDNTQLAGLAGEPVLPYREIVLLLPPGEIAESLEVIGENITAVPGSFTLYPKQEVLPISKGPNGRFIKNEAVYQKDGSYPLTQTGHLSTQTLNGFTFALCTFTPVNYNPVHRTISFYEKVTIRVKTKSEPKVSASMSNYSPSENVLNRVRNFAQNPEKMSDYPRVNPLKTAYQQLIITPAVLQNEYQELITMYSAKNITTQVKTVEDINTSVSGTDLQEKIRNYIKDQYQNNSIEYVLLGGNDNYIPHRGFYCHVISGTGYDDWNIPADLYYSGMDGNYDLNGNQTYGEVADSADLLPDVAVSRMPAVSVTELRHMLHKSVSYQINPVLGETPNPLLVGEYLYDAPLTFGGDYMNLLVDDHSDNGYFTHGIPSSSNDITRLYDTLISLPNNVWSWDVNTLLNDINQGHSFIHHLGHASTNYVMRLTTWDVTNSNFSQVDGIAHNYQLLYTQGCDCGGFDQPDCIASKMMSIDNFLACGVFNSRYGWFDQGTTEGPSEHLQREFVNALYTDTLPDKHFGTAVMISKIKTAPWVNAPGEFEPGAQRWCHYDCNAFGDVALEIWTDAPHGVGISENKHEVKFSVFPNPAKDETTVQYTLPAQSNVTISLFNQAGQQVIVPAGYSSQPAGTHNTELNLSGLQTGIYYCRIETGFTSRTEKLMIVR